MKEIGLGLLILILGCSAAVDIHFDDAASGFFLHTEDDPMPSVPSSVLGAATTRSPEFTSTTTQERPFTVLQNGHLVGLRAAYGPFLTRQTVPASLALPDLSGNSTVEPGLQPHLLDLSAHLVTREVRKDSPVLRVLFHTGQRGFSAKKKSSVCILLNAALGNRTVSGVCSPGGRDGTCLGELTIPAGWWPGLATTSKHPKIVTKVTYDVAIVRRGECAPGMVGALAVGGEREVGAVPLADSQAGYQQVAGDETLHLLIPQTPLYPGSRLYVPVFLEQPREGAPLAVVVLKCRARRGVRIAGVEEASEDWTLRVEVNSRGSVGTVTAFRKDANLLVKGDRHEGPQEIFNWLYVVEETEEDVWEGGKLAWQVKYQHAEQDDEVEERPQVSNTSTPMAALSRLRHRLEVRKDDVQTVVPISKSWSLMNTAVLTGRQVSQPMKIFIVSEAGKIADVTLHTSCKSADESALKAFFVIWMPESPLTLRLPDSKLSPIKNWRVAGSTEKGGYQKRAANKRDSWRSQFEEQAKEDEEKTKLFEDRMTEMEEGEKCHERYQQSHVTVLARFLAEDPDSGRRDYYISRNSLLDVTDLTRRSLRSSDPRVARLEGTKVQGASLGRTEIQVVSPLTGHVLGGTEVRVVKQRESVRGLRVRVVSGISLAIRPGANADGTLVLSTTLGEQLTSKYQEGLLDIEVEFSDGTTTPLKAIDPAHYYLTVDSLNPHVIAFAPVAGSTDPRVIAVGRGQGELLQLSLELADDCHQKDDPPLATTRASVTVDFMPEGKGLGGSGEERSDNKSHKKSGKGDRRKVGGMKSVDMGDLSEILSNIALRDDNSQSRQGHFDPKNAPPNAYDQQHDFYHHSTTPLEVGMYILLGVFCIAIAIFMASCFVYASKHQHQPPFPLQQKSQSVQNAHDWVWLGRQTLDKSSVQSSSSRDPLDNNANSIRSRESSRTYQARTTPGLPFRFEASADVNIFPNPCSEYGFNHGKRERVGRELYAELPRKRMSPRHRQDSIGAESQQLYQNSVMASPRLSSRSPFLERRRQETNPSSPASPSPHSSPLPSRARSRVPASPLVNSATYTRQRPVVPSQDILPVGFPVFCPAADSSQEQTTLIPLQAGFQNPWEALQLETRQNFFAEEEPVEGHGLHLDLSDDPPPGYSSLRQSPASALPPYPETTPEDLIITPEHMRKPRGEYIPLNPDINKPSPPRLGARKVFSDPFNITDSDAPPVSADQLSPSHIFSSLEELHREVASRQEAEQRASETEEDEREEEDMSATDMSGQEEEEEDNDNCSSVCSINSEELERDMLPDPSEEQPSSHSSAAVSPTGSLSRPTGVDNNPANLDSVALGSLDYEHLMNYFESLKESSA